MIKKNYYTQKEGDNTQKGEHLIDAPLFPMYFT